MSKKLVALTFDDGPNNSTTIEILDILAKNEVTASFFLIGQEINEETAKIVKKEFDMGCEIQNHSFSHSDMTKLTAEQIAEEIRITDEKIYKITGEHTTFFRPPYILTNDVMFQTVGKPFICGIGCRDWESDYPTESRIADMKAAAKDGTMYLLHDFVGNTNTVEALKVMIPWLKENDYSFVTVSEMFKEKNCTPVNSEMYSVVEA